MKLKTLKDMKKRFTGAQSSDYILNDVKHEVIKWRNNIPQLWEEWFAEYFKSKTTKKLFGEWLLDKIFNITEEDLK